MVNFLEMMTLLATKYFFNIREHIVPTVPQMLEVHNMCDYYFRALEESRFYDRLNLMYWKFILSGCTDERMTVNYN